MHGWSEKKGAELSIRRVEVGSRKGDCIRERVHAPDINTSKLESTTHKDAVCHGADSKARGRVCRNASVIQTERCRRGQRIGGAPWSKGRRHKR